MSDPEELEDAGKVEPSIAVQFKKVLCTESRATVLQLTRVTTHR
jgi:hypothetical protein